MTRCRIYRTRDRRFTKNGWRVREIPEGRFESWGTALFFAKLKLINLRDQEQKSREDAYQASLTSAEINRLANLDRARIEAGAQAADDMLAWVHRMSATSHQGSRIDDALPRIHFPTS